MTDPEDSVHAADDELREREADLSNQLDRDLPIEADEADAVDQKQDVPEADEDDYPG